MTGPILLDTGPLVAYLDRRDRYYKWTIDQAKDMIVPWLTCEPVLTEAAFLVRHLDRAEERLLELVARGVIAVPFRLSDEITSITNLLTRYRNIPMSLADACLVRMAEIHAGAAVFTVDGDFRIYRKNRRRAIPLIIPSAR